MVSNKDKRTVTYYSLIIASYLLNIPHFNHNFILVLLSVYCKLIQLKFTSAIIAFDLTLPCVIRPTLKLHSKPYCYIYKPAPDSYGSSNGYSLKLRKTQVSRRLYFYTIYYLKENYCPWCTPFLAQVKT